MLQENLQFLKSHYPDLYAFLNEHKSEEQFKLEINNDKYNISFKNRYIHSRYNPEIEAIRWVDNLNIKEDDDCIFVIGLGLGYYLDYLVKKYPSKKIIIVEPNSDVFIHCLTIKNLLSYIENEDIVFLVGKDANTIRTLFDYYVQNNKIKKIFYTELPIYKKLYPEYIEEVYIELKKILMLLQGNLITEIFTSKRWLYNTLRNLEHISCHNNIKCLEGLFSGMPVVIVSAGPSLEKNMYLLKKIYNRALIIAVGTAASILDSNGIEPHIIMGIDGNPAETTIFKKLRSTKPIFIYGQMIHFESLEAYCGEKMWINLYGEKKLEILFDKLDYKCPAIMSGGSIAHTGLAFAHWLKASTILLIGQDLAYSNKKLYASGSAHDDCVLLNKEGYIEEKDIYGNKVYTKTVFLTFKHWFEDYVKIKLQNTKLYNCTEGGLNIEGIPNIKFEEAIELYCNEAFDIQGTIKKALNKKETIAHEVLLDQLGGYKEQLIKSLELSIERVNKVNEIIEKKLYELEMNQYNEKIDEIIAITSQLEELEFYNIFIENTGKMYYEAVTRSVNHQLNLETELVEKRKIILFGLLAQYNFAHENLIVAYAAIEKKEVTGLF